MNELVSDEEASLVIEKEGQIRKFTGTIENFAPIRGRLIFDDKNMQFEGTVSKELELLEGTLTSLDRYVASGKFDKLELAEG